MLPVGVLLDQEIWVGEVHWTVHHQSNILLKGSMDTLHYQQAALFWVVLD